MEQSNQIIGVVNPTSFAPIAGSGGGSQPTNQPTAVNEAAGVDPTLLPPKNTRKRKPNASGLRRTSTAWDHFTKVPENEAKDPTAASHEQQNRPSQTSHGPLEGSSSAETSSPAEISTHLARADAFKKHLKEKNSIDQKNELERYLAESCVDGDDKFDLLLWWKQNSSRFPILSTLARDVLSTPVSIVASERAFSTGGRVLDTFRSSLTPEMAEALICAQNWLRPSLYQFKDLNLNEEFETSEKIVSEFHR